MANAWGTNSQVIYDTCEKAVVGPPLGQIKPALVQEIEKELQAVLVGERSKDFAHLGDIRSRHKKLIRQLSKCCKHKMFETKTTEGKCTSVASLALRIESVFWTWSSD